MGKVTVGCPPPSSVGEKSFLFYIHDFANLDTTRDDYVESPEFTFSGHQWELNVYPGGCSQATEGQVSVYLYHRSEGTIAITSNIKMLDKFGEPRTDKNFTNDVFSSDDDNWGWKDFFTRSDILDESQNILDDNGTLTVVVSIEKKPTTAFVPNNPLLNFMQEMFNDEATADICFEVVSRENEEDDDDDDGGTKRVKTTTSFYAHRLILQKCAPMLAAICRSNDSGGMIKVPVNDIKPEIFQHLLSYVYGSSVPEEELNTHAKDIIDAADKYSIVNLKLEAEAAYVEATKISLDNTMDNLLYADSRNCALLKEAVMNFLAENHFEAAANISFTDCPGHVMKDLLVAFGRSSRKDGNGTNVDDLTTLSVSALRRKLDKMGLDVDGSREAMIESIKSHS